MWHTHLLSRLASGRLRNKTRKAPPPWRRLFSENKGVALVEFGLVLPLVALLITGGIEISRFVLLNQKISRLAANSADLVGRIQVLVEADVTQIFGAAQFITQPFALGSDGVIIISSIDKQPGFPATVAWQRSGAGTASKSSTVGVQGANATMPGGFTMVDFQDVLVAEVFFRYTPIIFSNIISPRDLYYFSIQRPRFGSLTTILPVPPTP